MITGAREITVEDVRETVALSGKATYFVAPDAYEQPCVWVCEPDVTEPRAVLQRIDVHTNADWHAITGHLPTVTD
jgi:hypothetical protein